MSRSDASATGIGEVLALIPARAGSKSVPGKNLRTVLGKPLLAYSIDHALRCRHVNRVIVTTDSREIMDVALACGAEAPFLRPAEIAGDHSLDIEYFRHALAWLKEREGYNPDYVVNLRPTHPVRQPETIDLAIEVFAAAPEADSLRSVRLSEFSPYKMWRIGDDGYAVPVALLEGTVESYNMPRQQLPLVYWQDGYVDVTRPSVVFGQNSTTGRKILPFVIEEECVDIDYEEAFPAAEALLALSAGAAPRKLGTAKKRPPS